MKEFYQNKFKPAMIWFFKSFIWLGILFLIIDIVSKNLVVINQDYIKSQPGGHGIILIPGFLAINYVVNTGAAFGLSTGNSLVNRIVYIVIATIILIFLIGFFIKKFKSLTKMYRATMMLIACGALGNLIDRIAYTPEYLKSAENGVVDWINFFGIWNYNFNIADSCLVVGIFMLVIYLVVLEVKENKANKQKVEFSKTVNKTEIVNNETNTVNEENNDVNTHNDNTKLNDDNKDTVNKADDSKNKQRPAKNKTVKTKEKAKK